MRDANVGATDTVASLVAGGMSHRDACGVIAFRELLRRIGPTVEGTGRLRRDLPEEEKAATRSYGLGEIGAAIYLDRLGIPR